MKKLQANSVYNQYDVDGDGIVSDDEINQSERMMMLENEDKKQDAQRGMAWFALGGMLLYPFAVVVASLLKLDNAAGVLGDMAPTYFVSVAAIVAAFYGKEAYTSSKVPAPTPTITRVVVEKPAAAAVESGPAPTKPEAEEPKEAAAVASAPAGDDDISAKIVRKRS